MRVLGWIPGVVLLCGANALAGSFTYTDTVVATGSFEGTPFTGQTVTLTETANTSGTVFLSPSVYYITGTVTVTVAGIGTATFLDSSVDVFSNQEASDGGFYDVTQSSNILFNDNPSFATYDLSTAIGPLTGEAHANNDITYSTSGGNFAFDSIGDTATFTAVPASSTPEVGSFFLLATGLAALLVGRRRFSKS